MKMGIQNSTGSTKSQCISPIKPKIILRTLTIRSRFWCLTLQELVLQWSPYKRLNVTSKMTWKLWTAIMQAIIYSQIKILLLPMAKSNLKKRKKRKLLPHQHLTSKLHRITWLQVNHLAHMKTLDLNKMRQTSQQKPQLAKFAFTNGLEIAGVLSSLTVMF